MTNVVPFANFDPETGQYTRSSWCDATSSDLDEPNTYRGLVSDINSQYHDITNGVPVDMPPKPSAHHEFNYSSKQWAPNLAHSKVRLKHRIEAERDRRVFAPIAYDEKVIDGFERSQRNLADKLATIRARREHGLPALPTQLRVWRDANNITHTFPSEEAYESWLVSLAVALEERGTAAYAWSWQKKAALDAITTVAELDEFDPTE